MASSGFPLRASNSITHREKKERKQEKEPSLPHFYSFVQRIEYSIIISENMRSPHPHGIYKNGREREEGNANAAGLGLAGLSLGMSERMSKSKVQRNIYSKVWGNSNRSILKLLLCIILQSVAQHESKYFQIVFGIPIVSYMYVIFLLVPLASEYEPASHRHHCRTCYIRRLSPVFFSIPPTTTFIIPIITHINIRHFVV